MSFSESAVGKKVAELHDMELDSEKPETEGGDVACCASKRVSELHDLEFNSEKPKLITDGLEVVQVEDDDVSPKVLYDRNSTKDDPHQFFTDLAELAINFFMKRNVCVVSFFINVTIFLFLNLNRDDQLFV